MKQDVAQPELVNYTAPNGSPIVGVLEILTATALVDGFGADGSPVYSGESKMHYDAQRPVADEDRFLDETGKAWALSQLTPVRSTEDS